MKKGLIRIIAVLVILAIIPITVFAGFVCSHHDWKDAGTQVVGYTPRSDVPSAHWKNIRVNKKCSICGATSSSQYKQSQGHSYNKDNGQKTGYEDDVTNAQKHIRTVYHEKQCVCGKTYRTIVSGPITENHNYSYNRQVGFDEYGNPLYKYFCACGKQKPE